MNHFTQKNLFYFLVICLAFFSCNKDNSVSPTPTGTTYFPQVKSIIQGNCISCHSSSGTWSGRPVAFDSDSAIAAQSSLIKAAVNDPVTTTNQRMPLGGSLTTTQINTIVSWYNKGGKTTN